MVLTIESGGTLELEFNADMIVEGAVDIMPGGTFIFDGDLFIDSSTGGSFDIQALPAGLITGTGTLLAGSANITCFYGFVKVMTKYGEKEIKNLKRGDLILTNDGYQPLAKLSVSRNPTNLELFLRPRSIKNKTPRNYNFMVKIPKDAFGDNLPNHDIFTTNTHSLSLGITSQGDDKDFEFNHLLAGQLVHFNSKCIYENIPKEKYVYNLIFDKHYEINIGGLKFLSHHPNHNNGNIRLKNGEEINKNNRSKKVYVDKKNRFFKTTTLKDLLSKKPGHINANNYLANKIKFNTNKNTPKNNNEEQYLTKNNF